MRTIIVAFVLCAVTVAASPPDQLQSMSYLVGSWECTYHAGTMNSTYKATYAYDPSKNWLVERDAWAGGGDEGRYSYDPKRQRWVVVVTASDRSATVFEGRGDASHVVYQTVYPNADATETIDRASAQKYVVHFSQTANGQTTKSNDVCVKQ